MRKIAHLSSLHVAALFTLAGLVSTINTGLAAEEEETMTLSEQPYLASWLAHKAAKAAIKQCRGNNYLVSVSVVDSAGQLRILIRDDGAGPHTVESSRKKAYTAASMRASTLDLSERIANNPSLQGLHNLNDDVLMLGGGLPIMFGNQVIGGIGVAGAPGANLDDACARKGLNEINAG